MESEQLACCYFPTTVILVDDDRDFSVEMAAGLDKNIAAYQAFTDPMAACKACTQLLTEQYQLDIELPIKQELFSVDDTMGFNINSIYQDIYNPNRFKEISVVVLDFSMPKLNGLELCRFLPPQTKKILLTGESDHNLVLEAFNQRLIHYFISKTDNNLAKKINIALQKMQQEYFKEIMDSFFQIMPINLFSNVFCLTDPEFVAVFKELFAKHKLTEYYILDSKGNFLFLDYSGKTSWLAVANEKTMEDYYQLAIKNNVPEKVLKKIQSREMIPFFFSEDPNFSIQSADWAAYMHKAKAIKGKETYYYAYIPHSDLYQVNSQVYSFRTYLDANSELL
jgi:CheY-like chemotaxis protein